MTVFKIEWGSHDTYGWEMFTHPYKTSKDFNKDIKKILELYGISLSQAPSDEHPYYIGCSDLADVIVKGLESRGYAYITSHDLYIGDQIIIGGWKEVDSPEQKLCGKDLYDAILKHNKRIK